MRTVPPPPPPPPGGGGLAGRARRDDRAPLPDEEPPAVGAILRGRVASVRPFGIFVRMDGFRRDGLVHCTHVGEELTFRREDSDDAKVMAMEYFHPKDASVWVKVIDVQRDGYTGGNVKIALSMKLVDQADGKDLDPDGAQLAELARGGGGGGGGGGGVAFGSGPTRSPRARRVIRRRAAASDGNVKREDRARLFSRRFVAFLVASEVQSAVLRASITPSDDGRVAAFGHDRRTRLFIDARLVLRARARATSVRAARS